MSEFLSVALRAFVRQRAEYRCEYCLLHEEDAELAHEPDHVIALKHGGATREQNLAWACVDCNHHKGTDLTSIDPETGRIARLFNPRRNRWARHFRLEGGIIRPLTAQGRVTEYLLQLNRPRRVQRRELLILAGRYPR
jgi:hypothetical protein